MTTPTQTEGASESQWAIDKLGALLLNLIAAVRDPLGFFVFAIFLLAVFIVALIKSTNDPTIVGMSLSAYLIVVLGVFYVTLNRPGVIDRPKEKFNPENPDKCNPQPGVPAKKEDDIVGGDRPPPDVDVWYTKLRPTLHQASYYTAPTYYLDNDLYIVDFNIAFEFVFRRISGNLRGKHVLAFIKCLDNADDVFDHGKEFTNRVKEEGTFPFVDMELIRYCSEDFGAIEFTKIASQLHDPDGELQGWAVALMIHSIDWPEFEKELYVRLYRDKLWSVYSGAYDRILTDYPDYRRLIDDVLSALPTVSSKVADLGGGTGNVSAALVRRGHVVTAVENNIGMLDRFAKKKLPNTDLVKGSVENLAFLSDRIFQAVVMVNVLYAIDDPLRCLRDVYRVLKPGGLLSFSSTHSKTNLDALLASIKQYLIKEGKFDRQQVDYDTLYRINREIEVSIARRYTIEQYKEFVALAGFTITGFTESTYQGAVFVMHAKKPGD